MKKPTQFEDVLYNAFWRAYDRAQNVLRDCCIENIERAKNLLDLCIQIIHSTDWGREFASPSPPDNSYNKSASP